MCVKCLTLAAKQALCGHQELLIHGRDNGFDSFETVKLFESCATIEEISDLYQKTKHINGAFLLAKKRVFHLVQQDHVINEKHDISCDSSTWYTLQTIRAVYSKEFSIWSGDFKVQVEPVPIKGIEQVLPF